jgi:hypothetical protein
MFENNEFLLQLGHNKDNEFYDNISVVGFDPKAHMGSMCVFPVEIKHRCVRNEVFQSMGKTDRGSKHRHRVVVAFGFGVN